MLKSSGWVKIEGDEIEVLKELKGFTCNNSYLVGCRDMELNPLHEVNKLDNRAFAEEVLRHV